MSSRSNLIMKCTYLCKFILLFNAEDENLLNHIQEHNELENITYPVLIIFLPFCNMLAYRTLTSSLIRGQVTENGIADRSITIANQELGCQRCKSQLFLLRPFRTIVPTQVQSTSHILQRNASTSHAAKRSLDTVRNIHIYVYTPQYIL